MKFDFEYECDKGWDEMKGGDRRRFCDSCDKHVHHISGMTEKQARKFLEEHDYEVCVDFYRDDDGHTVFREAAKKLRMQNDGIKQLLASAAALVPLALAAAFVDFDEPAHETAAVMSVHEPVEPLRVDREPIDLDGSTPVVTTNPRQTALGSLAGLANTPSNEIPTPPIPVEPFVHDAEEPEPEPIAELEPVVTPRPHVRGRVRPPLDWERPNPKPPAGEVLPVDEFTF